MEWIAPNGRKLRLLQGDITRVPADAMVNAANSPLAGGGGVDGAIHAAGGPSIMAELAVIRRKIGRCPTGEAVATAAGELPAKQVFHAVGPVYNDGRHGESDALASCYRTCLRMSAEHGHATVSFPSISTGAYGYPLDEAARIAVDEVTAFLAATDSSVRDVCFVLFDRRSFEAYKRALPC